MISSIDSSAAARPISGSEPAPRPSVVVAPSWMMRSARDIVRACASVLATMNSTPSRPSAIMLLTALPPPPPTPITVIRGLSSTMVGLAVMLYSKDQEHLRAASGSNRIRAGTAQDQRSRPDRASQAHAGDGPVQARLQSVRLDGASIFSVGLVEGHAPARLFRGRPRRNSAFRIIPAFPESLKGRAQASRHESAADWPSKHRTFLRRKPL